MFERSSVDLVAQKGLTERLASAWRGDLARSGRQTCARSARGTEPSSGIIVGASLAQLGSSWAPPGLHMDILEYCRCAAAAPSVVLPAPLPQQLLLPTELVQDFICNARGSAKCNNTSFVLPRGCQVQQHCIVNETSRRRMATYATLVQYIIRCIMYYGN